MAEAMLNELSDVSRVLFVPDYNTAAVVTQGVYQTQGQVWTLVVSKMDLVADLFTSNEAAQLLTEGAMRLDWAGHDVDRQRLVLTALGSYQLEETLKASLRLAERGVAHSVVYMMEPGRFRRPRTEGERGHAASSELRAELYPPSVPARVFVTHTRPEPLMGVLQPLHTGSDKTAGLGFVGQGGTLTVPGMLFVNRCTWAHVLLETARLLELAPESMLTAEELAALDGKVCPEGVIV